MAPKDRITPRDEVWNAVFRIWQENQLASDGDESPYPAAFTAADIRGYVDDHGGDPPALNTVRWVLASMERFGWVYRTDAGIDKPDQSHRYRLDPAGRHESTYPEFVEQRREEKNTPPAPE